MLLFNRKIVQQADVRGSACERSRENVDTKIEMIAAWGAWWVVRMKK